MKCILELFNDKFIFIAYARTYNPKTFEVNRITIDEDEAVKVPKRTALKIKEYEETNKNRKVSIVEKI